MRGTSATIVSSPLPLPLPLPSLLPSVAPLRLTEHHSLRPPLPFCFKGKSFWCQGHTHHHIPGASLSLALDLALPLPSVACLV